MSKNVFIYRLRDPITREIRYVGASVNPRHRLMQHCSASGSLQVAPIRKWIVRLSAAGKRPEIEIVQQVDASEAGVAELRYIIRMQAFGEPLLNGKFYPASPRIFDKDFPMAYLDTRQRTQIRDAMRQRKMTQSALSKRVGVTREHVGQVLATRGNRQPSDELLKSICKVLGLSCEIGRPTVVIAQHGYEKKKKMTAKPVSLS